MLLRDRTIVASGPVDEVLTADHLRRVYDVEVDIERRASGQWLVIPVRRAGGSPRA